MKQSWSFNVKLNTPKLNTFMKVKRAVVIRKGSSFHMVFTLHRPTKKRHFSILYTSYCHKKQSNRRFDGYQKTKNPNLLFLRVRKHQHTYKFLKKTTAFMFVPATLTIILIAVGNRTEQQYTFLPLATPFWIFF